MAGLICLENTRGSPDSGDCSCVAYYIRVFLFIPFHSCSPHRAVTLHLIILSCPGCPISLHYYGQFANDVRILEDQDGAAAWENLLAEAAQVGLPKYKQKVEYGLLRPEIDTSGLVVAQYVEAFQNFLIESDSARSAVGNGYHFVDIPVGGPRLMSLRGGAGVCARRIKSYLTDLTTPSGLLGQDDKDLDSLDAEPLGVLDVALTPVSAGGGSEFLPEAYIDLYEPGNII